MDINIKILSTSASFGGVDYNERKNVQGKSELLVARNFGSLEMKGGEVSKADYVNYLKDYSAVNKRVKNPQFHAVLTCKGRKYTPEELQAFAEKYLDSMGYGDNPYLIYAHSDTLNNHVHIVTSRIDQQGAKIDHTFEGIKSQDFINGQILQQDPVQVFYEKVQDAAAYKFSTVGQFRTLLERQGYRSQADSDRIAFSKGGREVGAVTLATISARFTAGSGYDNGRVSQVRELFKKYRLIHDPKPVWVGEPRPGPAPNPNKGNFSSDLSKHMESKFGLEVVFHEASNKTVQGYTVIDHSHLQVYKGSEIMKLRDLVAAPELHPAEVLIETALGHVQEKKGFDALREQLKEKGLLLNQRGEVKRQGIPEVFKRLTPTMLKQLKNDDKLVLARSYAGEGVHELQVIAKRFRVDAALLTPSETLDLTAIRGRMNSALTNSDDFKAALDAMSLQLIPVNDQLYILDNNEKVVVNCDRILTMENVEHLMDAPEYHSGTTEQDQSTGEDSPKLMPHLRFTKQSSEDSYAAPVYIPSLLDLVEGDEQDPAEAAAKRNRRKR